MGALETNTTKIYGIHIRESANDGSDFSNGAADYRVLFLGEDGLLHVKDSAGTVTDAAAAGSVATDAIWDAAGDLAVGSGANTAAKLTKGADGTVLTMTAGAVGWASPAAATFHGVRAIQSGNTALTSGSVVYVAFDGVDEYDTDAFHDPSSSNTRLTIPTGLGGYYHISAASLMSVSIGSSYCVIRKNGTTLVANGPVYDVSSGASSAAVSCTLSLAQSDYVEFGIKVGASSKNSTDAGLVEPFFEMFKVG